MIDQKQPFYRHVFVYGIGAIALQVSGLLLLPLYTHYLSTAEYGVMQVVYRIGEMFHVCLMVQAIKLSTFNLVGTADDQTQRQRTAASVACVTFLSIVVGSAAVLAMGGLLDQMLSLGNSTFLVCGVLTMMLQSLTLMPLTMMQARFESLSYVCATVGIATCHVLITSFTVAVLGWGIWGVIFSLGISHGAIGVVLTLRELTRSSFRPDPRQIRQFVRFALPLVPVGVLSMAMHNGDQLFLMKYHGSAAVGIYALAYRLTQALEVFATEPLCQIWHPWIYKAFRRDDGPQALGKAATRILSIYLLAALGLVILRQEVVSLLSSAGYWPAAELIAPLIVAFFFMAATSLMDASFFLTSLTVRRTGIALVSAGVMLALYAMLIPRYGGVGAAYSTLIGFLLNFLITLLAAQYTYPIRYEYGRVAVLFGSAGLVAVAASFLSDGVAWILPKCLIWLAWPLGLWAAGVISEEEKRLARDMLRRGLTRI